MMPLLFTDPIGDDYGLAYAYPRAALYAEGGFADLTGFEALQSGEKVVLRVRLQRYPNPANAPHGFSLATVAIYIDTEPGGQEELPGAGFKTPPGQGWNWAYLLTGWKAEEHRPDGRAQPVVLSRRGEWLEVAANLPPGDYGYYVAVGLYDPFTPWHFRPVRPGGGSWVLEGPAGAPAAVDVLAFNQNQAYQSGVLPPVRAVQNRMPWALLSAALGLLSILLAFRFPRR
ncbi:glucodextranase DOMON-like domain-containing protein [Meiothermus rufus]|uniref:glucodextranase DOMON-like domain-containing protein n=1 Tax=Meiothermus rufus TaxID=604332 RepID=UPI000425CBD3|nr:glucodextranase DOMON-like domain-containing protein [Meiothermus rufus]